MRFVKYHHVERYGMDEVEGIDLGVCHVFAKLDGTNASVWMNDGTLCAGSRNRQLSLDKDNAGFLQWVLENEEKFRPFFEEHPHSRLFGEWLVPHTLKTYREDAWRRFWIFDVLDKDFEDTHVPYDIYAPRVEAFELDHIPPICTIKDPHPDQLQQILQANTFLVQDGAGAGEGIVLKNYDYKNKYGRQTWAKIVRNEFKEDNARAFGTTEKSGTKQVEGEIAEKYVTLAFVEKTRAKIELAIRNEIGEYEPMPRKQLIPRLLNTCYHELVQEEMWHIVKEHKNPTINFKRLQNHVIHWVKKHAHDLF